VIKYLPFFSIAFILVITGCVKKTREPAELRTQLPELGISVTMPPDFEPFGLEELASLKSDKAALEPAIEPFNAIPCYAFRKPNSGEMLIFSNLNLAGPAGSDSTMIANLYAYKKNLETYYEESIVFTNEIIQNDFTLLVVNILVSTNGENIILNKGSYYKKPDQFFMIELYITQKDANAENVEIYQEMFLSIDEA
jgi:hypothetical protein